MEIIYIGHSCFKLKGKKATVVCDPYNPKVTGFPLPALAADIVTVSHEHEDHNASSKVTGTSRREKPYVIKAPGEYEVQGVGVFGWGSFHDNHEGKDRGKNTMFSIHIDGVNIGHLGDLGQTLSEEEVEHLGLIDVLLVPVGGLYTVDASEATLIVAAIQPSYVIPMHYKSAAYQQEAFATVTPVDNFLKEMGGNYQKLESLTVNAGTSLDETEVVVLNPKNI